MLVLNTRHTHKPYTVTRNLALLIPHIAGKFLMESELSLILQNKQHFNHIIQCTFREFHILR